MSISAGSHTLTASKSGYASDTRTVTVTSGQVTTRDFNLATSGTDTDSDGLPDAWEQEHFGNLAQDADDDPDGDGLTNLEEYAGDSDPNVPEGDEPGGADDYLKNPWLWIPLTLVVSTIIGIALYARRRKPKENVPAGPDEAGEAEK